MPSRSYVTTAIPYVNGAPHLGHALELVQADVLARRRRLRGDEVRALTGTDDNALKNAQAAEAAGEPLEAFVRRQADAFAALRGPLQLSFDDFIRTGSDPRHAPAVRRLWQSCEAAGDLYERDYAGRYCSGCEAFLDEDELTSGRCAEHGRPPELVRERNWFFRLSRHAGSLGALLGEGRLRIEPAARRNEVLAFLRRGLEDVSVSRAAARARGVGIPVPGDPGQVVHVWFDALANYVSALGYGSGAESYAHWWGGADERLHVIGKGVTRFHALLWPALLLSAGEPVPTTIWVHDYVTLGGSKLSKSQGAPADPVRLATRYGADALRWWLVREVPRSGDVAFREERLAARAAELAGGLGNLVSRTVALAARARPADEPDTPAAVPEADALLAAAAGLGAEVDAALDAFDLRAASDAVWRVVDAANRLVSDTRPWELARAAAAGDAPAGARLNALLSALLQTIGALAQALRALLPEAAGRIAAAAGALDLAAARTLFPRPS